MTLLRLLVIILVLVNLVLLAQLRGWMGVGPVPAEHRPEPLHPERIRLLSNAPYVPPDNPPQAVAPESACLRFPGLKRDAWRACARGRGADGNGRGGG